MADKLFYESVDPASPYGELETGKKWYESKTIWVNIAGLVVMIGTVFGIESTVAAEIEAAILAVANIGLRLYTGEPLK